MTTNGGHPGSDGLGGDEDLEQALPDPMTVLDEVASGKPLDPERLRALASPPDAVVERMIGLWREIPPERRRDVLAHLERLGEDDATLDFHRIYLSALRDPDPATRILAVRGVGEEERPEYMRLLTGQLRTDPEASVRAEIADVLGKWVVSMEFGLLSEEDAEELASALRDAVEDIEEQDEVRGRALEALGASSEESVGELIGETYEVGSHRLKLAALRAMGRSASESWLPVLIYHFDDEDPEVRAVAATASGELLVDEAVEPLAMLLGDNDEDVQVAAARALGEIGSEESERILARMLRESRSPQVREAVREALAEVHLLTMEMVDHEDRDPDFEGGDPEARRGGREEDGDQ